MIATALLPPSATYTDRLSRETTTPTGFGEGPGSCTVAMTAWVATLITETVPLISFVTYARRPSGANAAARGRTSTRKLATTVFVFVSITDTVLLVSAVT